MILPGTVYDLVQLIQWLPDALASDGPDVIIDDDGDICLEWYVSKGMLMTVWCRDGHVAYAGIVNGQSLHGRSDEVGIVPHECVEAIKVLDRYEPETPGEPK
jgi:hypothetical protein